MLRIDSPNPARRLTQRATRLIAAGLLAALAGVAVTACGSHKTSWPTSATNTIDNVGLERAIAKSIRDEHHLSTRVICPAGVSNQQGASFSCYAHLEVGRYRVPVTENNGQLQWHTTQPIVVLKTVNIERAIELSVKHQRHVAAKVKCPSQVLQAAHIRFTCVATTRGNATVPAGRYTFQVTETDGDGHVTYVGN